MPKPVWMIQRELEYAQARETYYRRTDRPIKATRDAQPRQAVAYRPLFYKVGAAFPLLKLQASEKALAWFGAANLGLSQTAENLAESQNRPYGFGPSLCRAMVGDATPTIKKAYNNTGRRYIKYSGNTTGEAQAHYQAPISAGGTTPSIAELENKIQAIISVKKTAVGDYGRLYFDIEKYTKSGA